MYDTGTVVSARYNSSAFFVALPAGFQISDFDCDGFPAGLLYNDCVPFFVWFEKYPAGALPLPSHPFRPFVIDGGR